MRLRLPRRRRNRSAAGTMPLTEHLIELRRRILISFAAVFLCGIVVFVFYNPVIHFLSQPYVDVTHTRLAFTDPLTPLLVRLKISLYGGLALSVPIIMWQVWRFIVPGMNQNERRYAFGFFFGGIVLFLLGCVVAWFTISKALDFLLNVGGDSLRPVVDANKYLTLVMLMFAAFGFSFEFPLLLLFLLLVGVVNTTQLRHSRRWAAVGLTTFAAIITPSQDPFSLLFMAVPLYIFYEMTILIGRLLKR